MAASASKAKALRNSSEYITDPKTGRKKLAAAVALGSIRTPAKSEASRRNGALNSKPGPGQPPQPLLEIECAIKAGSSAGAPCPGGEALEGHHWSCPRGQAIKRRIQQGRDVWTGKAPASEGGQAT